MELFWGGRRFQGTVKTLSIRGKIFTYVSLRGKVLPQKMLRVGDWPGLPLTVVPKIIATLDGHFT